MEKRKYKEERKNKEREKDKEWEKNKGKEKECTCIPMDCPCISMDARLLGGPGSPGNTVYSVQCAVSNE